MLLRTIVATLLIVFLKISISVAGPTHDSPLIPAITKPMLTLSAKNASLTRKNKQLARWVVRFKHRALAVGVSKQIFDSVMGEVRYRADVIEQDRNQSEFTKTIWDYLDVAVSENRVANGRRALRKWARTLDKIEVSYGVDREVIVAIWGLESAYGRQRGDIPVFSALATLAFDGRRGTFFEAELIAALKILQNGDTSAAQMIGSWAGAMGHTQFIPTSYNKYAVEFSGDGRRDIWSDNPTDALASTAAYLAKFGWVKGKPWGVEVRLPAGFDYALAQRQIQKLPSVWAQSGVLAINGATIPDYGKAALLLPGGAEGAAFLVFQNFAVLEHYNTADAYVIAVGHLADRISGGTQIKAKWPRTNRALTFAERKELQRRLSEAGFNTRGVDGKIGPLTIAALRSFQHHIGVPADGYASLKILKRLRRN